MEEGEGAARTAGRGFAAIVVASCPNFCGVERKAKRWPLSTVN